MNEPNEIQSIAISLPASMKQFVEDQVVGEEYASISGYISSLVVQIRSVRRRRSWSMCWSAHFNLRKVTLWI